MICTSFIDLNFIDLQSELKQAQLAELRLDRLDLDTQQLKLLLGLNSQIILSCHTEKRNTALIELIKSALPYKPAYLDIPIESASCEQELIAEARSVGVRIIISYHNFTMTPERTELVRIRNQALLYNPDIVKIACYVNKAMDNTILLSLLNKHGSIISVGMGELGILTRVTAPLLGAPFTYAALSPELLSASGQLTRNELKAIYERVAINF
jgi:3-dehydroquinate dehydratase-1